MKSKKVMKIKSDRNQPILSPPILKQKYLISLTIDMYPELLLPNVHLVSISLSLPTLSPLANKWQVIISKTV